jgi:hypothetical protein
MGLYLEEAGILTDERRPGEERELIAKTLHVGDFYASCARSLRGLLLDLQSVMVSPRSMNNAG